MKDTNSKSGTHRPGVSPQSTGAPGKQPLAVQLKKSVKGMSFDEGTAALSPDRFTVQRAGGAAQQADGIKSAAAHGIQGGGQQMPHLGSIQRSFGQHDVSNVQAHVGGAAADASKSMGADAYATGNHVAFKSSPDLHTAAHEAAHVVQQRGGVSLKGGVGQVGDSYEKQADAVASKVVAGESAESTLGAATGAGGGEGNQVQRMLTRVAPFVTGKAETHQLPQVPDDNTCPNFATGIGPQLTTPTGTLLSGDYETKFSFHLYAKALGGQKPPTGSGQCTPGSEHDEDAYDQSLKDMSIYKDYTGSLVSYVVGVPQVPEQQFTSGANEFQSAIKKLKSGDNVNKTFNMTENQTHEADFANSWDVAVERDVTSGSDRDNYSSLSSLKGTVNTKFDPRTMRDVKETLSLVSTLSGMNGFRFWLCEAHEIDDFYTYVLTPAAAVGVDQATAEEHWFSKYIMSGLWDYMDAATWLEVTLASDKSAVENVIKNLVYFKNRVASGPDVWKELIEGAKTVFKRQQTTMSCPQKGDSARTHHRVCKTTTPGDMSQDKPILSSNLGTELASLFHQHIDWSSIGTTSDADLDTDQIDYDAAEMVGFGKGASVVSGEVLPKAFNLIQYVVATGEVDEKTGKKITDDTSRKIKKQNNLEDAVNKYIGRMGAVVGATILGSGAPTHKDPDTQKTLSAKFWLGMFRGIKNASLSDAVNIDNMIGLLAVMAGLNIAHSKIDNIVKILYADEKKFVKTGCFDSIMKRTETVRKSLNKALEKPIGDDVSRKVLHSFARVELQGTKIKLRLKRIETALEKLEDFKDRGAVVMQIETYLASFADTYQTLVETAFELGFDQVKQETYREAQGVIDDFKHKEQRAQAMASVVTSVGAGLLSALGPVGSIVGGALTGVMTGVAQIRNEMIYAKINKLMAKFKKKVDGHYDKTVRDAQTGVRTVTNLYRKGFSTVDGKPSTDLSGFLKVEHFTKGMRDDQLKAFRNTIMKQDTLPSLASVKKVFMKQARKSWKPALLNMVKRSLRTVLPD